ncbi:hypothetical protein H4R20_003115 [Coemansia guatemalensis]|uniref:DUF788-domain-containing protein n=1 Tax=Coemansia guatemalensis TaxID=2761395 RepID=A0A9W8HTX2_9FUNG|nr:hypothetical protein H4R20_003115 [Coemansia guatemalensis]
MEAIAYLLTGGIEGMLYMNLRQMAQPRYDPGGVLVDSGTDLKQPGLVSYMFDYVYISWIVHVLSLFTKWAWMVYLAIPAYLVYMAAPYARQLLLAQGGSTGQQGEQQSAEDEAREKKRREKKERKQQRVKYVRG